MHLVWERTHSQPCLILNLNGLLMKNPLLKLLKYIIIAQILAMGAGCKTTSNSVLHAAEKKRESTQAALKKMSIEQLHQELIKESERGLEPFNSMTLREIGSRGQAAGASLAPLLKKPDRS